METKPYGASAGGEASEAGTCSQCGALLSGTNVCTICNREPPDPRVGVTLANKYVIEERIGGGGMGAVYRGRHIELGEPVAVKFLLGSWAENASIRTRFRREALALARLRHPSVVSVLDFGEHETQPFLVMELVKGTTLEAVIQAQESTLPLTRIGPIFEQLLQVLEAAHAAKIVHRDVKPSNVMLADVGDRTDRVKLLDFGLVRFDDGSEGTKLTESGQSIGTPCYMSPEQCRGVDVGAPTDVYAVGIMLYEALCGSPPFQQSDGAMVMAAHMFVEPPPMHRPERDGAITPGLEAVVRRALAKRAEDRPTIPQMRDEFASALRGTDAASMAARAASDRARIAMLSRSERAVTGVSPLAADPSERPTVGVGTPGHVILWLGADARTEGLTMALAVNGTTSIVASGTEPPGPAPRGHGPASLVIVSAQDDAEGRVALLRSHATLGRTPILVVDVEGAKQMTKLIRCGASDMTLVGTPEEDIVRKARRLLARGR